MWCWVYYFNILARQRISMDRCILLVCVIAGLQVQPVSMGMSILCISGKLRNVIGTIFNHQVNDKNPCGWTRNYMLIFILVYSKTVDVLGIMEIPSNEVNDTVFVFLPTWSLLCSGRCWVDVVVPFLPFGETQCWGLGLGNWDYS